MFFRLPSMCFNSAVSLQVSSNILFSHLQCARIWSYGFNMFLVVANFLWLLFMNVLFRINVPLSCLARCTIFYFI